MGTGHWRLCRRQCPPIHSRPLLPWGQLKGLPLALPDGHECVATGGPQVVFVLFIALLPLPLLQHTYLALSQTCVHQDLPTPMWSNYFRRTVEVMFSSLLVCFFVCL